DCELLDRVSGERRGERVVDGVGEDDAVHREVVVALPRARYGDARPGDAGQLLAETAGRVHDDAGSQLRQLQEQAAVERQVDDTFILDHRAGLRRLGAGQQRACGVITLFY